ncbi:uncharacterized protein LOC132057593 [Lycium ferocissimum]|uniref:uncharacterized protein LOC132057593 n=1 Tax=Lycium ferocissimum TaxID=112874 RepID=UPI002814FEDD|nr:uncharacterized protein LOC132057593 [Lycium ferocissimum]
MTPFQALYGYEPPQPTFELIAQTKVESVNQLLKERKILSKQLKKNLIKAQSRMKHYADSTRSEREIEIGDLIFIKLQPYRQTSVALRKNLKLASKFFGPYPVIKKISPLIGISPSKQAPNVFPVKEPPFSTPDGQLIAEPIAILDRRMVKKRNIASTQVLVQRANLAPEDATWEDFTFFTTQFPEFQP